MPMRRRHVLALAAGSGALLTAPALWAQPRTPLLIDGKKTLYQRVLTRPGAALAAKPGEAGGKTIEPFTLFFVYERARARRQALAAGRVGSDGKTQGYLIETDMVALAPHDHVVVRLADQSRTRAVLPRAQRTAEFVNADNAAAETQRLKEIAAKGTLGPGHAVIAAEPEKFVDLQKQFYLLPVLEAARRC